MPYWGFNIIIVYHMYSCEDCSLVKLSYIIIRKSEITPNDYDYHNPSISCMAASSAAKSSSVCFPISRFPAS